MAVIYLSSVDGDDGDSGADWANAKATTQAAMTAAGAGGRVYFDSNHSESFSVNTILTSPGTPASPQTLLSVNRSTGALEAGASLSSVAGSYNLYLEGAFYAYGLTLSSGNVLGLAYDGGVYSGSPQVYDSCALKSTGYTRLCYITNYSARCVLINTTWEALHANAYIIPMGYFAEWRGGSVVGATLPTALFNSNNWNAFMAVSNVDLSSVNTALLGMGGTGERLLRLSRCRLHASVARITGTLLAGTAIEIIACDSGTNYLRNERETYEGVASEDTVRIRDNSDSPYSFKMVSSANTAFHAPLRSFPVARYNAVEGEEITVRVYTLTDGVTLQDDEFWLEVNYLGNASYPLGSLASSAMADILATPANLATSTEGWTTTDITTPVKQYAEVSFTAQESGPIEIVGCLAKASTTAYMCPDAEIS